MGKDQACGRGISKSSTYSPGHFLYCTGFARASGSRNICFPGSISGTCKGSAPNDSRKGATEGGLEEQHRDYNSKVAEYFVDSNSPAHSTGRNKMTELKPQTACSKRVKRQAFESCYYSRLLRGSSHAKTLRTKLWSTKMSICAHHIFQVALRVQLASCCCVQIPKPVVNLPFP